MNSINHLINADKLAHKPLTVSQVNDIITKLNHFKFDINASMGRDQSLDEMRE